MSDQYRINGNVFSWASMKIKTGSGNVFTGFTSVNYADKRERVKQYGMGRHHAPRGRSAGKYSTENVKLGGAKSSFQALRKDLASQSADGKSYGNVEFELSLQYVEPGSSEEAIHVQIERCVLVGNTSGDEESPDPLKEEVEIDCMLIRRNGLVLFDETEGSP